jgi:hypothetical protein
MGYSSRHGCASWRLSTQNPAKTLPYANASALILHVLRCALNARPVQIAIVNLRETHGVRSTGEGLTEPVAPMPYDFPNLTTKRRWNGAYSCRAGSIVSESTAHDAGDNIAREVMIIVRRFCFVHRVILRDGNNVIHVGNLSDKK